MDSKYPSALMDLLHAMKTGYRPPPDWIGNSYLAGENHQDKIRRLLDETPDPEAFEALYLFWAVFNPAKKMYVDALRAVRMATVERIARSATVRRLRTDGYSVWASIEAPADAIGVPYVIAQCIVKTGETSLEGRWFKDDDFDPASDLDFTKNSKMSNVELREAMDLASFCSREDQLAAMRRLDFPVPTFRDLVRKDWLEKEDEASGKIDRRSARKNGCPAGESCS